MKTVYVVTGAVAYEGETVLAAFGSRAAAVYYARRVDMFGYDEVEVRAWRGPTHLELVLTRERER